DDSGIVHDSQIATAVDCLKELLAGEKGWGYVLGAMQSGKTTTSLALQWVGPIMYLIRGEKAYPFYLVGNQKGHEEQTQREFDLFREYHEHIGFKMAPRSPKSPVADDAAFMHAPTLATYREQVL